MEPLLSHVSEHTSGQESDLQILHAMPVHDPQDVDQRITRDVERLAGDMAALVPTMVKPVVDILWFSTRLWALTGRRGMAVLYIYAALGFGCLRCAFASS